MTTLPHSLIRSTLLLVALVLPGALAEAQEGEAAIDVSEAISEVDAVFERFDSSESPGCAVAVSRDGRPLLSRAYGMADMENPVPNTPSTLFEAGSVSKQFTAAAVILLALDGELDLDDDVREYVPEVPDYGETITIRHLMTHTSGLRDWGSVAAVSGWGRPARSHTHAHVLDIIGRQNGLNFSPGSRYSYSNSGYNLMAVIVERVSGRSLDEFTRERLFDPLGMTHTRWRDDYRDIVPGRSAAYSEENDGTFTINRPIEHVYGNAALLTTVGDLLIWNRALATGRVVGDAFLEKIHEPMVLTDGREIHYAGGLQHLTDHGQPVVQHTGATSGYRAYLARFPDEELSVAVLCNVTTANPGGRGSEVAGIFLESPGDDEAAARTPEGITLPADELERRAGYYRSTLNGAPLRLVVEDGELRIENGASLIPVSENEFQVGDGNRTFHFEPVEGAEGSGGERDGIRATFDGGYHDQVYRPVDPFDPSEGELEAFTGAFRSDDAETTVRFEVVDGELVAHRRPDEELVMDPLYTDAFQLPGFGLVRFVRDDAGRVAELSHSRGRVYDLRFHRLER